MRLERSPIEGKKWRAVFKDGGHTDFGSAGMDDYTLTKDKDQRQRYIARHRANENWNDGRSAGALSRYILWGESTSRAENLRQYKIRFPSL